MRRYILSVVLGLVCLYLLTGPVSAQCLATTTNPDHGGFYYVKSGDGSMEVVVCGEGWTLGSDLPYDNCTFVVFLNAPTCVVTTCSSPDPLVNGVVSENTTKEFGDNYTATCDAGFELAGSAVRTCVDPGLWNGTAPSCHEINECENVTCEHGTCRDLINGYECDCDYGFVGTHCDARVSCPDPQAVKNGTLSLPADNMYEAVYNITCDSGYELVGSASRTCQSNGTWSGCEPSCLDANNCTETICGQGTCHDLLNDFVCFCDDGYTGTLCDQGVSCPDPQEVKNGTLSLPTDNMYEAVYNITCDSGYERVGFVSRTCRSDGTWSGSEPLCLEINDCKNVTCVNGVCQDFHESFECFCKPGFNGTYCEARVTCPVPQSVNKGTLVFAGNNAYEAIYNITCGSGYELVGSASRTCQSDGSWSGCEPTCREVNDCENITCQHGVCQDLFQDFRCDCEAGFIGTLCETRVSCPTPQNVHNAVISRPAENVFGAVYNITCSLSYDLAGSDSRTCKSDGTWSGCEPLCLGIDDCAPVQCVHGTCQDLVNDFNCICEDGYTGRLCDTDINECLSDNGGCEQRCVNLLGTRFCYCDEGYILDDQDDPDVTKCKGNFGVQMKVSYETDYDEGLSKPSTSVFKETKRSFEDVFVAGTTDLLQTLGVNFKNLTIQFLRGSVVADMGFSFEESLTITQRSIIASVLAEFAETKPVKIAGKNATASATPLLLPVFPESGIDLEVTSVCSLYDESRVCGDEGYCVDEDGKPVCICADGSSRASCYSQEKGTIADTKEIVYIVVICLLILITLMLTVMICCMKCSQTPSPTSRNTKRKLFLPKHPRGYPVSPQQDLYK